MDIDFAVNDGSIVAPLSPAAQLLGFVVPGGPVRIDFVPVDASGAKYTLTLQAPGDLPTPLATVSEVVCFILPNAPLPPQHGILIYWQVTSPSSNDGTGFELLGTLRPDRPSAVYRTGWAQNESLQQQSPLTLTLGVSVEPLGNVVNVAVDSALEHRLFVAQKIATDLFNFMQSFDTGAVGNMMTVPTNIFDRWMKRFEARFRRDPNFFMKNE